MAKTKVRTRQVAPGLTTISTCFNRFAPFGCRKFVAVGNRATAIKLKDGRVLLLNPVPLEHDVRTYLTEMGGVHFVACDLGHHLYVAEYVKAWPEAKCIGVSGLERKRRDILWDFIYHSDGGSEKSEEVFGFSDEIETVFCEGFITRAIAWYHRSSQTLIVSDLLMNLPPTEQYTWPRGVGPASRVFSWGAHPRGLWLRMLLFYLATTDYATMRRDVKRIADWEVERIVPCHGDVIEGRGNEAWYETWRWLLEGPAQPGLMRRLGDCIRTAARRVFLM